MRASLCVCVCAQSRAKWCVCRDVSIHRCVSREASDLCVHTCKCAQVCEWAGGCACGYSTAGMCVKSEGVHAARHAGCSTGVGLALGQVGGHQGVGIGQSGGSIGQAVRQPMCQSGHGAGPCSLPSMPSLLHVACCSSSSL